MQTVLLKKTIQKGKHIGKLVPMKNAAWMSCDQKTTSTLPKTNSSPLTMGHPKRKASSSKHPFSGAISISGRVPYRKPYEPISLGIDQGHQTELLVSGKIYVLGAAWGHQVRRRTMWWGIIFQPLGYLYIPKYGPLKADLWCWDPSIVNVHHQVFLKHCFHRWRINQVDLRETGRRCHKSCNCIAPVMPDVKLEFWNFLDQWYGVYSHVKLMFFRRHSFFRGGRAHSI